MMDRKNLNKALLTLAAVVLLLVLCPAVIAHAAEQTVDVGIPFVLSAVLIDKLKAAFDFVKKNYKVINLVCGIFLIVIGILMATGMMGRFLALLS